LVKLIHGWIRNKFFYDFQLEVSLRREWLLVRSHESYFYVFLRIFTSPMFECSLWRPSRTYRSRNLFLKKMWYLIRSYAEHFYLTSFFFPVTQRPITETCFKIKKIILCELHIQGLTWISFSRSDQCFIE